MELKGWVTRKNQVGGVVFIQLRDGTGSLQVSAKRGVAPADAFRTMEGVTRESAVAVRGDVRKDQRAPGGVELAANEFEIASRAEPWPITKTAARSRSFLFDKRHLSVRGPKATAAIKVRAEVIGAAFDFFRENGFTLISAPTFVQAAVEGGSTLFEVNYFGKKAYLSQSAQYYEEADQPAQKKV